MRAARARTGAIGARATRRASSTRARRDAARVGASAASKSSSPSSERDDIGADGAGVAVVGVGARGCALVDALVDARALSRAETWAMHADEDALERSRAANRWRLPPANVEATTTAIEGNAASAARAVMAMGAPGERAEAIDALERSMAMASVRAEVGARDESGRGKRNAVMAGNWKLNPKTLDEARTLAALVGAAARDGGIGTNKSKTEVFVCPPAPFAAEVARTVRTKRTRDATKERDSIRIERG